MNIPKTIFIVPYRNRPTHKKEFVKHFNIINNENESLDKEKTKLFFINQNDNRPFNRGAIKNIGFIIVKNLYPTHYKDINLIFHDIDTIPFDPNLFNYTTINGTIKHYYGFKYLLGGMFAIKASDYELIKGFPNFWGWGYEDNVISNRAIEHKIKIDRTQFYKFHSDKINRLNDEKSDNITDIKLINKREISMYINKEPLDNLTHIKDLDYISVNSNDNVIEFNINNFSTNRLYNKYEFQNVDNKTRKKRFNSLLRGWYKRDWNMFRNIKH